MASVRPAGDILPEEGEKHMIKPWSERVSGSSGVPAAQETVLSVLRGFGVLTGSGWPEWYAQKLMEDYPVFDSPGEYTYENLVHYGYSRMPRSREHPEEKAAPDLEPIGKSLEEICPRKYADSPDERWDALHDILFRLVIEPVIFLTEYESEVPS